jgi:N-acetylglucosaminyldiphosphoundecaprenol N-acetyl-beta-D-mannosaminyltransferase
MAQPPRVNVLGVEISTLPVDGAIELISRTIASGDRAILSYVNVYALNLAYENPWFKEFLNHAALTFCDGFGVKWGARLLGHKIPERYTPPDWFPHLAHACYLQGFSLYFLGARPGVAEKCANLLSNQYPGLIVSGSHHGYFDKSQESTENQSVIELINKEKPDILVVGLGMPVQEKWLKENWDHLDASIALPVGAMFDYLAGEITRAPRWMTDHGLEWLGRLVVEPKRLSQRYILGNPLFLGRLLKQRFGFLE